MITHLFTLARRYPGLRRLLWRVTYNAAARHFQVPAWTCMNYGYAPEPPESSPSLTTQEESEKLPLQLYDRLVRGVNLLDQRVLEIGSGRGGGAAFLARHFSPRTMTGLDFAQANIRFCRGRHREPNLSFLQGDAEEVPLMNASFDLVINVESSHCYGSFPKFVSEVSRVLVPGGRFLYTDFRDRVLLATWRQQLAGGGLEVESESDLGPAVRRALELDAPRRRSFIEQSVPGWLRPAAREFVGLPGFTIHRELTAGTLAYHCFVLRRIP